MTNRYGYGYGEEDPLASRRGSEVTRQRADEPEQPEQEADVREIDLAEDDDERAPADERLRPPAGGEADDEGEPQPPLRFGPFAGAADEDDEDEDRVVADEAAPADAATVDIDPPSGDGDQAAVLVVDEDDEDEDAGERAAAETGDAGESQGGMTLAPLTPAPGPQTAAEAVGVAESPAATAVAPAGATPAPRPGALLPVDAEVVRRQFIDIQAGFVDEPRQAVEQAGELVEELHRKVVESLQAERGQLSDALDAEDPSTEDLRQALRAYRAYVDRLLGLSL
jgi:hypothetical protein